VDENLPENIGLFIGGSSSRLKVEFAMIYTAGETTNFVIQRRLAMRILVVEDEPDLLRSLAMALRDEGYAVDTADNGEDGLFNAASIAYDAIVLDVMLPKLDGWQVLSRLRKTRKTPVLMLTARDTHRDRVRGLDAGADDYLVKPFDLGELHARLRALIRRAAGQTTTRLEIGDVSLDTASRTVTREGKPNPSYKRGCVPSPIQRAPLSR
jgi:two-component system OmpR family response regulator